MTRLRLWLFMFGVVALGVCGPVALTAWVSHEFAEQQYRQRVEQFTTLALARAELVARDAIDAARQAAQFQGQPCSDAHLAAMREADLQHRYTRQIVYLDGRHACSSSAVPDALRRVADNAGTWIDLPLLEVAYRADAPEVPFASLQFRVGHHITVVDPQFLADIIPLDDSTRLGMIDTRTGSVLAAWADTNPSILTRAWRLQGEQGNLDRQFDVKTSPVMPIAVVAYEPFGEISEAWRQLLYTTMPVAVGISALATWLLLRWGRRFHGPEYVLRDAIRRKEFFAVYQPVMSLADGRCIGAEALIRWRLPDGKVVMPDRFVPMAETVGVMHAITQCMLENIIEDLGGQLASDRALHVSVNLAPDDFRSRETLQSINALLARTGIDARQIWIEVTERGFVDDAECRETIAAFREAGHPIYIDDFGTGYSSLAYLHDLDIDGLKIDKAFVESMTTEAPTKNVGPHIIEMAKALGVRMVAEGIETEPQRLALRQQGVQYGQGWLFGKPMAIKDFLTFWRDNRTATQAAPYTAPPSSATMTS
ncbi:EAL domain-containing protein [Cupriavidus sp. BIS7]|uniref:EAL domain-containing protein n=1 Tax=Cupriavidus sp. BIS7 TaxID=1217718 RepID=UPI00030C82BF|nr:EAL domain-containing protein [Cupriavidus sp. BIS7]